MSTKSKPSTRWATIAAIVAVLVAALLSLSTGPSAQAPLPAPIVEALAEHPASSVLVTNHRAYRALREQESFAHRPVSLLASWPPQSLVLSYMDAPSPFEAADMSALESFGGWVLWEPRSLTSLPIFGLAQVETIDRAGDVATCPRDDGGMAICGEPEWMRPGPREVLVHGVNTACIWAHPLPEKTLRITYPETALVDEEGHTLTLLTGLRDNSVGTRVPVQVDITLGATSLTHTHHDRRGWQAFPLHADAPTASLTLDVRSRDPGRRHFCYRFEYR